MMRKKTQKPKEAKVNDHLDNQKKRVKIYEL